MNFKHAFLFTLLLSATISLNAQTEKSEIEQINETINGYIVGTAYNYPDSILSAFMPGTQMFLDKKGQPLFVMTVEEYASRVAKSEPGKFNGRETNVLSIDQFEGIATAKLEVLIPSAGLRFIDLLLLKKLEEGWKIISKTAARDTNFQKE